MLRINTKFVLTKLTLVGPHCISKGDENKNKKYNIREKLNKCEKIGYTYRFNLFNHRQAFTFGDIKLEFVELCSHSLNQLSTQLPAKKNIKIIYANRTDLVKP